MYIGPICLCITVKTIVYYFNNWPGLMASHQARSLGFDPQAPEPTSPPWPRQRRPLSLMPARWSTGGYTDLVLHAGMIPRRLPLVHKVSWHYDDALTFMYTWYNMYILYSIHILCMYCCCCQGFWLLYDPLKLSLPCRGSESDKKPFISFDGS